MHRILPFLCLMLVCQNPVLAEAADQSPSKETVTTAPATAELSTIPPKRAVYAALPENARLIKVVALARHGVRSPVQSMKELRQWSERAWPDWPVPPGDLTPRGAELVSALWDDMRQSFAADGLLPVDGCPPAGSVYVYADAEQRTRATAEALLNGLAPGCGLSYLSMQKQTGQKQAGQEQKGSEPNGLEQKTAATDRLTSLPVSHESAPEHVIDPLFHPVKAGLCRPDESKATDEVPLAALQEELKGDLQRVAELTGPADPALCLRHRLRPGCAATDIPSRVKVTQTDAVHLDGGLGIASSLAEIWLLQAAQWPAVNPAWNNLNTEGVIELLPVHTRLFNAVERAPSVALPQGSPLLSAMTAALAGNSNPAANAASLVVFVGHDTSIAHVAALLGLHWRTESYPADAIPPGSILMLTLWQTPDGTSLVRAGFVDQGLDVLRSNDPQVLRQADPERADLHFGFPSSPNSVVMKEPTQTAPTPTGAGMPLSAFVTAAEALLDPLCLPK